MPRKDAILQGEIALGALEGRFWLFPDLPWASEAAPLLRAFTQVPSMRSACAMANFRGDGRCLPPPFPKTTRAAIGRCASRVP